MEVKMYTFPPHGDDRGQLVAIEAMKDLPFEIRCGSGKGCRCLSVKTSQDLSQALRLLLTLPLTEEDTLTVSDASWHYRIGGEADEA